MKFGIIDPRACTFTVRDFADVDAAELAAGLTPGAVDHGTVARRVGIIVSEYGLYEHPAAQHYFSIDRRLYAGPAVLYQTDSRGVTIDLEFGGRWFGTWYANADAIEEAIAAGKIDRPQVGIGDAVVWRWPAPKPDLSRMTTIMAERLAKGETVVIDGDTIIKGDRT
jgi:hypothetical protein